MPPLTRRAHPDLDSEQAYIERAHKAELARRDRLERSPESANDKVTAREMRRQAMEALQQPVDVESLCFGRIDLATGQSLYLGRRAVRDDNELLVINWRLPIAAPFYEANVNNSRGLTRRRRFDLDQLRLLSIVDETFERGAKSAPPQPPATRRVSKLPDSPYVSERSPLPDRVPPQAASSGARVTPQPPPAPLAPEPAGEEDPAPDPVLEDAILADMDRARGPEMRDIVATIEARQYELISDGIDGVLAIQGGPGSGKTAIALHRAAWLLFNHQQELERSGALVVGPNRAFMEYIARVLPSLGETSVTQMAIDKLFDQLDVRVRADEPVELARLKGDPRLAEVVQRAVRARVRTPAEDTQVTVGRVVVTISASEIRQMLARAISDGRTYLAGRAQFQRDLLALTTERVESKRNRFLSGPGRADIERAVTGTAGISDRIWPAVTAVDVIRDLFNSRQRMASAGGTLTDDERSQLLRERARAVGDEPWTSADIALLDEAETAIRGVSVTFGYVLVDEAQDLSPMQLRMVFRRTQQRRATLVGDIAQSTAPWRFRDWDDLLRSVG